MEPSLLTAISLAFDSLLGDDVSFVLAVGRDRNPNRLDSSSPPCPNERTLPSFANLWPLISPCYMSSSVRRNALAAVLDSPRDKLGLFTSVPPLQYADTKDRTSPTMR